MREIRFSNNVGISRVEKHYLNLLASVLTLLLESKSILVVLYTLVVLPKIRTKAVE